jgi:glycerol-3-phosphate O-acyltransferase
MAPIVAVIVAEPTPELVASPFDPVLLLMTATSADELVHVTLVVMFFVLPSVYVPVAANCCEVPNAMAGFKGASVILTSVAGETESEAVPEMFPNVAVTVTEPTATLVASP